MAQVQSRLFFGPPRREIEQALSLHVSEITQTFNILSATKVEFSSTNISRLSRVLLRKTIPAFQDKKHSSHVFSSHAVVSEKNQRLRFDFCFQQLTLVRADYEQKFERAYGKIQRKFLRERQIIGHIFRRKADLL